MYVHYLDLLGRQAEIVVERLASTYRATLTVYPATGRARIEHTVVVDGATAEEAERRARDEALRYLLEIADRDGGPQAPTR